MRYPTGSHPLLLPLGFGIFCGPLKIAVFPVFDDGVTGFGQPHGVLLQLVEFNEGKIFAAIVRGTAQGLKQSGPHQHGKFVGGKTEIPCGFLGCEFTGFGVEIEKLLTFRVHGWKWF